MNSFHQTGALAALLLSGGAVMHAGAATVFGTDDATSVSRKHAAVPLAPEATLSAPVLITRSDDDLFYVRVRLDGHESMAVLDTGASRTVISRQLASRLGLKPQAGPVSAQTMRTLGGTVPFQSRKVSALHVEGMALGPIDIAEIDGLNVPLILGQDAIARFRAVEIRNRRLILR